MSGSEVSLIRAIRGPVTLITVGVLFALNNFTPYRFDQTWPVLLIVFGLLSLMRRGSQPRTAGQPGAPGYSWPPPPSAYPPGGYRQSSYTGVTAPSEAGTSEPARPNQPDSSGSGGGA